MPYNAANDPWGNASTDNPDILGGTGATVTPSDTVDLTTYTKALVVTATGNLVILPARNVDGTTITFTGCPVGMIVPYRVRRVLATGTTATVATIDR